VIIVIQGILENETLIYQFLINGIVKNALKDGKKEQNFILMMSNLRKTTFSMSFL
jgi:hypothetical protein